MRVLHKEFSVLTTKWAQLQFGGSRFGRVVEDSSVLYCLDVEGGMEGLLNLAATGVLNASF